MRDLSLRLPYLIYLSIACILLGVLAAPIFRGLPEGAPTPHDMRMHAMTHGELEVPAAGAPEVAIEVTQDEMDGWNVTVTTENFTFTPRDVNGENAPNSGHAHLYLNELKLARLYGPHFHIPALPEGEHTVSVSLSANDHSYYIVDGARIEATATVVQEAG